MAQADAFLKIDGIKGESKDKKLKDAIPIASFSQDFFNLSSRSGSKPHVGKFRVSFEMSKATVSMIQSLLESKTHKKAEFIVRRAGKDKHPYLEIEFENLTCDSVNLHYEGDAVLNDAVFSFTKITKKHTQFGSDGSKGAATEVQYDLVQETTV